MWARRWSGGVCVDWYVSRYVPCFAQLLFLIFVYSVERIITHAIDHCGSFCFIAFIVIVVGVGIWKSRHEGDSESYFLAGRGLRWWLIGVSLIAANISTEQFVGMSGQAADYQGLAPASYEWLAAITLVVVAFFFLPYFLRAGIFTMPEFLEHRYNSVARTLMALCMLPILILLVAAVTYSGALTIQTAFHGKELLGIVPMNVTTGAWLIGLMAGAYVASGGLKACVWADLIQGTALVIGGGIIAWCAFSLLGDAPLSALATTAAIPEGLSDTDSGLTKFFAINAHKLHMVLPKDDPNIPWTALLIGLWIPNFYYWGSINTSRNVCWVRLLCAKVSAVSFSRRLSNCSSPSLSFFPA